MSPMVVAATIEIKDSKMFLFQGFHTIIKYIILYFITRLMDV